MKKYFLASFSFFLLFTVALAATSISNRLDGDMYYNDEVFVSSGATYGDGGGVEFEGDGSLILGRRVGNGFPRVVIYGGTDLTVNQDYGDDGVPENRAWKGVVKAPVATLSIPFNYIEWENDDNHTLEEGEVNVAKSYGFESFHETYGFSSPAYVVLPINAPNGARIWYGFHNLDPENLPSIEEAERPLIGENDFCIVKDGVCILEVESMNQVVLLEESFERCPRSSVPNGSAGSIPYCVITCDEGYEPSEDRFACYSKEGTQEESVVSSVDGSTGNQSSEPVHQSPPAIQGDKTTTTLVTDNLRYIGSGDVIDQVDTAGLTGKALKDAQKRNAVVSNRRKSNKVSSSEQDVSGLKKMINDIRGQLWSWERAKDAPKFLATNSQDLELKSNKKGEQVAESYSSGMHSAAPMLPSTGSSTIFVIISILGIGLMLFAFRS